MLKAILLILLLTANHLSLAKSKSAYLITDEDITRAAQYFKKGLYAEAQAIYLNLASAGDKYAQYVLSVIELQGLVEKPDLIKAYAWAKVAKENSNEQLKKHFEKVSKLVVNPNDEKLLKVSSDIYSKYSNIGVAQRYLRHLKNELPRCTGSRLRGNLSACGRTKVSCDPNVIAKGARESCLEFVAKIRPENLKRMKNDIDKLQTYIKELKQRTGIVIISDKND